MHYQRIPSLQEYVMVSQEARVEIFRRTPSGTWEVLRSERRETFDSPPGRRSILAVLYADLPL